MSACQLLGEMGLGEMAAEPTITYGDNRAANLLCEEDIITCGNQFMQVPYHYNKEAVRAGIVEMKYIPTADNIADLLPTLLGHRPAISQLVSDIAPRKSPRTLR
eukprot:TRINITY_DN1509_c0_g1_i12.p3 TRINITY_DN1509_c0_g1~~TRINITY_DN1509_c0_g1_i12.p3  ORF type:complete len:104 (-),score=24.52 TRINITY_DN1509_c0_g1_i12:192-503(-)